MSALNEMKVAAALLRAEIYRNQVSSVAATQEIVSLLQRLEQIALYLADAPYLFRDDAVLAIAQVISEASGLDELRGESAP